MTDYMTALPVILVQPTCPGDQRAKGVQLQLTCNLCRESHKTQVWLCFLVLSFLSTYTSAASVPPTLDAQLCLRRLKPTIELQPEDIYMPIKSHRQCATYFQQKSDAMLYAPSIDDVKDNCRIRSLRCYMLELIMVTVEEEIRDKAECIRDFNQTLRPEDNSVDCPPCEAYSLKNITIFLERLNILLQSMNV